MNAVASKINSPEYNEPSAQVNTPALASLGGVCRHDDIIFDNKDAVGSFKKEITKPKFVLRWWGQDSIFDFFRS